MFSRRRFSSLTPSPLAGEGWDGGYEICQATPRGRSDHDRDHQPCRRSGPDRRPPAADPRRQPDRERAGRALSRPHRQGRSACQAWRFVARDTARAEAAALDREAKAGHWRGPLHGIPIGIKDIIDVAGITTLANSRSRADSPPATADADIVASLRLAGAGRPGQDPHHRVCLFRPVPRRATPTIPDIRPAARRAASGAAVGAGMVAAGARHPDGRLGQPARGLLRRRGVQAEHAIDLHPWRDAAVADLRHDRLLRRDRARRGGAVRNGRTRVLRTRRQ
ncbi:MAG: amidase family protein [Pseudomonadota bacterium]